MSDINEKDRLTRISEVHSYSEGFNGRLTKHRAMKIKELYSGGGILLDLGAGEGFLTRLLANGFEKIEIAEASFTYIEKAKELLAGYPVIFSNKLIEEFDTKEEFDLIVASGILEHVKESQEVLKKVRKWLKKEGLFIAIVPNATSLHRQVGLRMGLIKNYYELGEQDFKVGHRRCYDLDRLKTEVEQAGLTVINSGGILLKPLPNAEMEQLSEGFCDALYEIGRDYPELCAEVFVACKKKHI